MPAIQGSTQFTGMLGPNSSVPAINVGGITSGVGPVGSATVAPGDLITISGQYFAAAPVSASQLPLTTDLATTEVFFAGVSLPLVYSSSGTILAIVPYNLPTNAQYQLIVTRSGAISGPAPVTVADAQPGILEITANTNPALAQNVWNLLTVDTPPALSTPATPFTAGNTFIIYCTGLGGISQALDQACPHRC